VAGHEPHSKWDRDDEVARYNSEIIGLMKQLRDLRRLRRAAIDRVRMRAKTKRPPPQTFFKVKGPKPYL
jgi:hypothetical protein